MITQEQALTAARAVMERKFGPAGLVTDENVHMLADTFMAEAAGLTEAARLLGQAHRLAGFSVSDDDAIRQLDRADLAADNPLRQAMIDAYREASDE